MGDDSYEPTHHRHEPVSVGHLRGHEPEIIVIVDRGEPVQAIVDGPCAVCFMVEDDGYRRRGDV